MFRNANRMKGLPETSLLIAAVVAIAATGLVGCGTDLSTAPDATLSAQEDGTGEVPLPVRLPAIPAPIQFEASELGHSFTRLSWMDPGSGLTAQIRLDGVLIAELEASAGGYVDALGRGVGEHVYGLCYVRGQRTGREAEIVVEVPDAPGTDDSRTDKRPQDGR